MIKKKKIKIFAKDQMILWLFVCVCVCFWWDTKASWQVKGLVLLLRDPSALTESRGGIRRVRRGGMRERRGELHVSMRSRSASSLVKHHRSPQWHFTAHAVYTVTAITHSPSRATAWARTHTHNTHSRTGRWLIVTVVVKLLTALSVKGKERKCTRVKLKREYTGVEARSI